MSDPIPWAVLQALRAQLAPIAIADDYNTDIGQLVLLNDTQRDDTERPSIAIGATTGELDLTAEHSDAGQQKSRRARRMAIVIEAGVEAAAEDAQRIGHLMLEDIERAMAVKTCSAPLGMYALRLTDWEILNRPDGINAVVLRINGSAEYGRPLN